ncbi:MULTISPECIES: heme-binding protein [unclassified Beijerinckia]|uniref:GlcG/HbpS family heme-binding protein n=1 Tax=unclassified Beijerinckia TaxID=2638183 RepID=UPI00089BF9CD|nr:MULTISPECIES: heme-binding protein [unclassified Beijerinckia]MDH7794311.1 glc operon protein GlcG [Beijerinckia sp. GAS462]SEB58505.1 glc operon protein GlcG [Beijerinckia sp. 28-YEA-48]
MPDIVPTHRLTHEATMKMLAAGVAKADEIGVKIALAVCDQSCQLLGYLVMDGARFFAARTTTKKAMTAASQRLPSGYAPPDQVLSMQIRMDGDFTNMPGGFPIVVNGQVIGGIGAGGAKPEEDVIVAQAALAALGLPETKA